MKLTKEMFDFEKYEYSFGALSADKEYVSIVSGTWTQAYPSDEGGGTRIMRTLKPPPRYILLNEGEKLRVGDEYFTCGVWSDTTEFITRSVCPGEVWRRKDTTK